MHLLFTGASAGGSMQRHLQQGHGEVSVINNLPQPEAGCTRAAAEESVIDAPWSRAQSLHRRLGV